MRKLLLLMMIHVTLRSVQSVNGVIWDKKTEDFVPIFSIPVFATMNQELLNRSLEIETHNFQGNVIRLTYYEIKNIINTENNGTRVSGATGEIWNTMSEFLNFTLKPIISEVPTLGHTLGKTFMPGLLKTIQFNETDVIPRLETHLKRLRAAQFSHPLWKTSLHMYIPLNIKYIRTWMVRVFSPNVWYAILATYCLLSFSSYLTQTMDSNFRQTKSNVTFNDHLFYNFGVICGQSFVLSVSSRSSKIVELWLGLFSFLVRTAFGALLISYLTQTNTTPPFHDVESLLSDTPYDIVTEEGTYGDMLFKYFGGEPYRTVRILNRHRSYDTTKEMHETLCSGKKLYAMTETDDMKKASGQYICKLNEVGMALHQMDIVSGIAWNFTYKRTIDKGIIKFHEVGIIKRIKDVWIESKNVEETVSDEAEAIIFEQVYLIILIFGYGALISFIIFIFEVLTFCVTRNCCVKQNCCI
ncbi:uncharacterized protein LOC143343536 [Colletes latitarsis]|uniref:uncharacterized protein LOC143343536 n=1 Tax=Colletes latitarsis TaxID=2605962 RepID=UPI0040360B92